MIYKPFECSFFLMWPFSIKSVMRNRWWTLAFAAFVCWQAYDFIGPEKQPDQVAQAAPLEELQKPMSDADAKALEQALGAPQDSAEQ